MMKFFFQKYGVIVFLLLIFQNSVAQDLYLFQVFEGETLKVSKKFQDSATQSLFIEQFHLDLISTGFIEAQYDTISNKDFSLVLNLKRGPKFIWHNLNLGRNINDNLFSFLENGKVIDSDKLKNGINLQLEYYENNGYPFANVFFDSVSIERNKISGNLKSELGRYVVLDSIIIKGGAKTSRQFILRQIGIAKGDVYQENKIKKVDERLRNVPFIEIIRGSEVFFTEGKATLALYLKDKSASRFDGIIGLNPDEVTGKLAVVGDLKINLLNAFKRGERLNLNWESVKENTQNYSFDIEYPFLFGTKIGFVSGINYFRQDTTFANLNLKGGFSFFLENQQKVAITANLIQSNSLLSETTSFSQFQSLRTIYLGVSYELNSLDYIINPRRGWDAKVEVNSGNKTISGSVNSPQEGEELQTSFQIKSDLMVDFFLPVFKKSTMNFGLQAGNIFGKSIFDNELYQIGGLNTLRGFNQQAFLVSNFVVLSTEFRYLFDQNSSVFGFIDASFYEKKTTQEFKTDTPIGFGAGVNFQTGAGIFTLTYGLGKQEGNPILIKNGKVHFGFISLF